MRILVICGAGASSTFVAQRLRAAALAQGHEYHVTAGGEGALDGVDAVDLVLVGPHLAAELARIKGQAAGVMTILLPRDVFDDRDGTRTFDLVRTALAYAPVHEAPSAPHEPANSN